MNTSSKEISSKSSESKKEIEEQSVSVQSVSRRGKDNGTLIIKPKPYPVLPRQNNKGKGQYLIQYLNHNKGQEAQEAQEASTVSHEMKAAAVTQFSGSICESLKTYNSNLNSFLEKMKKKESEYTYTDVSNVSVMCQQQAHILNLMEYQQNQIKNYYSSSMSDDREVMDQEHDV